MQVNRTRYTPTDIGPSPSDWGSPRLSEVSTLITNGFVGTASPFYSDETGVSYLYGTNVRANKIDLNNLRYITREFHQDQQKTSLRAGDLLTVQSGHIGETAVVPKHLENANCHALIVTRLKPKLVNSDFLCQYINSEIGIARLRGLEVGSTIAHINTKDLKKFRIPLPPLPEQKKIAAILSTWDRAIEGTEKLLANSQQQKKALMQQLLTGKKRLPGFTEEWKNTSLYEICTLNPKSPKIEELTQISFIPMDGVSNDARISDVTIRAFKKENNGFSYFQEKDVLVAKITPCFENGKGGYLNELPTQHGFGSTEFHVLRATANADGKFIYYITTSERFRILGEMNMQGSAGQKRVPKDFIERFSVNLPPLPEQKAIATVLTTADEEITAIESDLSRLRQEKKALMQQLLTGKRRVTVD